MENIEGLLKDALSLRPVQKAELIDKLLISLDEPSREIEELMVEECESRVAAYEKGDMGLRSTEEVFSKYKK